MTTVPEGVESCRNGTNPGLICRVPSGWAVLCDMQYLSSYCILLPDPLVESLNALDRQARSAFLCDMAVIGDALLEVTDAYRVNYAIAGNTDPTLHAHIIPRYLSEADEYRRNHPWSYPREAMHGNLFDPQRDKALIANLARSIQKFISK